MTTKYKMHEKNERKKCQGHVKLNHNPTKIITAQQFVIENKNERTQPKQSSQTVCIHKTEHVKPSLNENAVKGTILCHRSSADISKGGNCKQEPQTQ